MLTTNKVNSLKPKDEPYSKADGHGLHIYVRKSGTKVWRQKYRYNGKEGLLTHGKYPYVTLAEARKLRDDVLTQLTNGENPSKVKRQAKAKLSNTFGAIAKEWFDKQAINWKPIHADKVWRQMEADLLPYLKDESMDKISPTDLLEVLKKVEARGALDVASRLRQRCEAIFKHAILTERAITNPATQLVGVLKTKKVKHLTALDHKELPAFFGDLEAYERSHPVVKLGVKIIAHTFIRSKELRFTTWGEIDFDERIWLIPADRMKMDADHFVPLTDQVIDLFKELQKYNGKREFVFASPQRPKQPISSNAMIQLIYRMGYKNKATIHGFRTTASTYLNETGYNPDAIERQLSHAERNQVRAAYNRSEYLEERKRLLKDWSQYLDSLSNNVVPIQNVK
jgi:integrase